MNDKPTRIEDASPPFVIRGNTRLTPERMERRDWIEAVAIEIAAPIHSEADPEELASCGDWLADSDWEDCPTLARVRAEWRALTEAAYEATR